MAAIISIRVCTGASCGVVSNTITGIDLMSADGATNSSANRAANPITAGQRSYDKWLIFYVDAAPDNALDNLQFYGDGAFQASTHLYVGKTNVAGTPTSGDSPIAAADMTNYTTGARFAWHATDMTGVGSLSDYLVLQLDVDADAAAGNWTQETLTYTYDET